MQRRPRENGLALLSVLLLTALVTALLTAYFLVTRIDISTTGSSMDSSRGFYAAEAGVNLRSAAIRSTFVGYNVPAGVSPDTTTLVPCEGSNYGSGDFACTNFGLQSRNVDTFLIEPPGNPMALIVPLGEPFQNLNASDYRYLVNARANNPEDITEASLEMQVTARLIPMFQFAAFYNKDLEILPGPAMVMEGPIHTNGDLYVDSGATLDITGQVTSASDIYRGRKNQNSCAAGPITVPNPSVPTNLPPCAGGRTQMIQSDLDAWNGMVRTQTGILEVPAPDALDPVAGNDFFDLADLRVALDMSGGPPGIVQVRTTAGAVDAARTAILGGCGALTPSNGAFFNNREGAAIDMLEVDVQGLLDCLQNNPLIGVDLDDADQGGLVFHFSVDGPSSGGINNYGVRLSNAAEFVSTVPGAPAVRGMTVVTDQAIYLQGHYNAVNKKPASVMADSLNVLSTGWVDATSYGALAGRVAANTTVNTAFLGGTDVSGGIEGAAGQDLGGYNGGLENYPRFHETWSGRTLTYRGSFVSLYPPAHVNGGWVYGGTQYTAPIRDWRYDTMFNNAANLPPMSPRFVQLKQSLFVRRFEM